MIHAEMVEKIDASLLLAHGEMLNALSPEQSEATIISLDAKTIINVIASAGFALVPLEATEEMIRAGEACDSPGTVHAADDVYDSMPASCQAHWAAMIGARPGQEKEDV